MVDLPRPDSILTHESDLDGLLAGLLLQRLAQKLHGATPPIQAFHNHAWRQRPMNERAAWVCDFAIDHRIDRPDWVIIDHHPFRHAPQKARLIHDPLKSASLLVYELCVEVGLGNDTLQRLVHLGNVADLFLDDSPDFETATDYAGLVKHYGFWPINTLLEGQPERLLDHPLLEVMQVKRRVEDPIGLAWSRERVTRITDDVGLVETLIGNTNRIIHQLLDQKATPHPVLVSLYRRGNAGFMASIRSRNGQAQVIAEKLQGGGHPNAAGATLPRAIQTLPDAAAFLRQLLEPKPAPPPATATVEGLFNSAQF